MTDNSDHHALALYSESIVWDDHSGFMPHPNADLTQLNSWRDAGVTYLSVNVGFDLLSSKHAARTIESFRDWIQRHDDRFLLLSTSSQIRQAKESGKVAISFDIEGMNCLDGRLDMLEWYYRMGVRQILIAYNRNNLAGGGCHDNDSGLTAFGREAVREMNALGMFVDVSHCGYRTSMDAMEYSRSPVIFSHSNPRSMYDHERNIRDEQVKACAERGGVVGVVGLSRFLGHPKPDARCLADHIEYLLRIAGPGHVGIGLDYSFPVDSEETDAMLRAHPEFWPPGKGYDGAPSVYAPPSQLIDVTRELLRRGHSEPVVRGVLGENFLRLAEEVWGA